MRIKIDKLIINTKGVPNNKIRDSIDGLDKALLEEFAHQSKKFTENKVMENIKIDSIKAHNIATTLETSSNDLQKIIAKNIAQSVYYSVST